MAKKNSRPNNRNVNPPAQEEKGQHYKQYRKEKRTEKNLVSTFGNNLKKSEYMEYVSKNGKKKFDSYEFNEEEYFSKKNSQQSQKSWGTHRNESYKPKNYSQSSSDSEELLYQYTRPSKTFNERSRGQKGDYSKRKGGKQQQFKGFREYWSEAKISENLRKGEIFQGVLYSHEEQRQTAFIKSVCFDQKILLDDVESQNRAFSGAAVFFKIIKVLENKQDRQERKELDRLPQYVPKQQSQEHPVQSQYQTVEKSNNNTSVVSYQDEKDWDSGSEQEEVAVKYYQCNSSEIAKLKEKYFEKKLIGEVVGVLKDESKERPIVGRIDVNKKNYHKNIDKMPDMRNLLSFLNENYYFTFKPLNHRLPWFNIGKIDMSQSAQLFSLSEISELKKVDDLIEMIHECYFQGKFQRWGPKEYYPLITVTGKLGLRGDIEIECQALLTEHQIYTDDFGESCVQEMEILKSQCNENQEYIIPEEERKKRLDLTKEIICTVDPATARDLDDALSVVQVEKDIFEIGVHIADVSHFVKENTAADDEAQLRTTSVYLVHRVIPMLPRILCENMCSLNPQVERLAFSIFFYITRDGEVLWERPPRVHKTIIKTCAKFSYDIVNEMIEGKVKTIEEVEQTVKISSDVDKAKVIDSLLLLNELGQKRRNLRLQQGSLVLETNKLRFQLDESNYPISYSADVRKSAQFMVEEWMLLANQFVGLQLIKHHKESAVLRKHEPPQKTKFNFFQKLLKACKLNDICDNLDISTSEKLQGILDKFKQNPDLKQEVKDILSFKLVKLLEAAKYFVVSDSEPSSWHHFALNFDVYTHFTSPIRRYPDILVHRLLEETLIKQGVQNEDDQRKLMEKCNQNKLSAKRVSDGCQRIFMCLYLKSNPVFTDGYISEINGSFFSIIVPMFNLEIKRKLKDIKSIIKFSMEGNDEQNKYLVLEYKDERYPEAKRLLIIEALTKVQIQLTATTSFPIEYQVNLVVQQRSVNEEGMLVTTPKLI